MINCEDARRLILRAIDDQLDRVMSDALVAHLAVCTSCRFDAETQQFVQAVLRRRPAEPLPRGALARLSAELDAEASPSWMQALRWRTWSLRLLPIAAAAAILAVVIPQRRESHVDRLGQALLSGGVAGGSVLLFEASDRSDDSLVIFLLASQPLQEGP